MYTNKVHPKCRHKKSWRFDEIQRKCFRTTSYLWSQRSFVLDQTTKKSKLSQIIRNFIRNCTWQWPTKQCVQEFASSPPPRSSFDYSERGGVGGEPSQNNVNRRRRRSRSTAREREKMKVGGWAGAHRDSLTLGKISMSALRWPRNFPKQQWPCRYNRKLTVVDVWSFVTYSVCKSIRLKLVWEKTYFWIFGIQFIISRMSSFTKKHSNRFFMRLKTENGENLTYFDGQITKSFTL